MNCARKTQQLDRTNRDPGKTSRSLQQPREDNWQDQPDRIHGENSARGMTSEGMGEAIEPNDES